MENNDENLGSQEPVQETENTNTTNTASTTKSLNIKPVAIIVAAVAIVLVLFFMLFTRSAKSVVKDYVKAFSKADADKVMALMDYEGAAAFRSCSYGKKLEKFDDEYKKTMDKVKDLSKDEKAQYEEAKKSATKSLQSSLDLLKASDMKMSVKNVKTEKVDGSKKLTKVTATMKVKYAGQEAEQEVTFYTMKKGLKHYIVSSDLN